MVKPPTVTQGMLGIVTRLLEQSQQLKGVKYRYGGLSTSGIDCSGFVFLTLRDQFKLTLPRSTQHQAKVVIKIPISQLIPGDLV